MFTQQQLSAMLHALPDPAFVLTRSGRCAAAFGGRDARHHHDGSGLVGKTLREVLPPAKAEWFSEQVSRALRGRRMHVVEYELRGSPLRGQEASGSDHPHWFEARIRALDFPVQAEDAVLWVTSNITERKAIADRLREQSETDVLSGLANRRRLMAALEEHFEAFRRYGTPTSVLALDIDRFKQINDTLGHHLGDAAIVATASACLANTRATDLSARLGGDEFVVLMPHTPYAEGLLLAERLRRLIVAALAQIATQQSAATISAGLSAFLGTDQSGQDALRRADQALYAAKRGGRNRLVAHPSS